MVIAPPWPVLSPIRAAGWPPIITVNEPITMGAVGPTQVAISPIRAAGKPPIRTRGQPGGRIGPPTCGTKAFTMGQLWMSDTRAAGLPILQSVLSGKA